MLTVPAVYCSVGPQHQLGRCQFHVGTHVGSDGPQSAFWFPSGTPGSKLHKKQGSWHQEGRVAVRHGQEPSGLRVSTRRCMICPGLKVTTDFSETKTFSPVLGFRWSDRPLPVFSAVQDRIAVNPPHFPSETDDNCVPFLKQGTGQHSLLHHTLVLPTRLRDYSYTRKSSRNFDAGSTLVTNRWSRARVQAT